MNSYRCAGLLCLLVVSAVRADDAVVRYGDSKGVERALLSAAGELNNIPYRVEWVEFPATAPALEALAAGAIDLRGSAAAPLIFAAAAGAPIKEVAALRLDTPGLSVAILVPPGSPLRTAADLRGKRIATNKGSVGHHLVLAALRKAGIPLTAVSIQYLFPADARAALSGGSVDAWSTWDPYTSLAEVQDHLRPVVTGEGLLGVDGGIIASSQALAAKRTIVADFIKRIVRAEQWGHEHLDSYAQLMSRQTGLPPDAARLVADNRRGRYVPIDDIDVRGCQLVADLYLQAGVIRQPVDVSVVFDRSILDGK